MRDGSVASVDEAEQLGKRLVGPLGQLEATVLGKASGHVERLDGADKLGHVFDGEKIIDGRGSPGAEPVARLGRRVGQLQPAPDLHQLLRERQPSLTHNHPALIAPPILLNHGCSISSSLYSLFNNKPSDGSNDYGGRQVGLLRLLTQEFPSHLLAILGIFLELPEPLAGKISATHALKVDNRVPSLDEFCPLPLHLPVSTKRFLDDLKSRSFACNIPSDQDTAGQPLQGHGCGVPTRQLSTSGISPPCSLDKDGRGPLCLIELSLPSPEDEGSTSPLNR